MGSAEENGPYCIPFPGFLDIYRVTARMCEATGTPFCLLLCTLSSADGRSNPEAKAFHGAMEQLEQAITRSLRAGDVFTRYSGSQFLVVLIGAQEENLDVISQRISQRFQSLASPVKLCLDCQLFSTAGTPFSGK